MRRQRARAADVDALKAARALPRIDIGGKQPAAARVGFFHGVEEGSRTRHRVSGKQVNEFREIAEQSRLFGRYFRSRRRDEFMESGGALVLAIAFAYRFGQAEDLRTHHFALCLADSSWPIPVNQQVGDVVHAVRDRRIRADQRAFHAAGTQDPG